MCHTKFVLFKQNLYLLKNEIDIHNRGLFTPIYISNSHLPRQLWGIYLNTPFLLDFYCTPSYTAPFDD